MVEIWIYFYTALLRSEKLSFKIGYSKVNEVFYNIFEISTHCGHMDHFFGFVTVIS
jgi:hypothetical protein